jgi:tetratricopeptide (TPR) repeat protein
LRIVLAHASLSQKKHQNYELENYHANRYTDHHINRRDICIADIQLVESIKNENRRFTNFNILNIMKKIIISSVIILATLFTYAGEKEYMQAMEKNLQELEKANTADEFQTLADNFEIIGEEEGDKWLPYYYVTFSYLSYVFTANAQVDTDMILDKADAFLEKARELSPENDEIEVLQGWIYQGRIQVDPMGRGQLFSQKASESFGKAKNINPDNPRIYFLVGQNVLHTPEMFGGGEEAACPYFKKAEDKFDSFKAETPISPDWGRETNFKQLKSCES